MKQKERTPRKALVVLLSLISKRSSDPIVGDAAFSELHARFESRIKKVCKNIYYRYTHRSHKADVDDLCQSVLEKVCQRVITFRVDECEDLCEREIEQAFLNWISGIARNELRDQFSKKTERPVEPIHLDEEGDLVRLEIKQNDVPHLIDEMIENISDTMSGTIKEDSPAEVLQLRLDELISTFPAREVDILYTHYRHSPYNIPTKELDRLQSTYAITRENIRQIKRRTLKKLKSLTAQLKSDMLFSRRNLKSTHNGKEEKSFCKSRSRKNNSDDGSERRKAVPASSESG